MGHIYATPSIVRKNVSNAFLILNISQVESIKYEISDKINIGVIYDNGIFKKC